MKSLKRIGAFLLSVAMTLTLLSPALPAAGAAVTGKTYYVSTLTGSDSYDGLSEAKPFYTLHKINNLTLNPGDKVYLERGSVFENQFLHIKGSGAAGSPIVIDAYGTEGAAKPLINTNGNGIWYQNYGTQLDNPNHVWKGYVSSSILLFDVEHIEISNLAMTNGGDPTQTLDGPTVIGETGFSNSGAAGSYTSGTKMNRTGVAVVTQDIGTAEHIYLKDLDIQNVYGNIYDKHMNNGGIYFTAAKPHNEAVTGISRFDDLLIDGCYLKRTSRWGIAVAYTAYWNRFVQMAIPDAVAQQYGATNVVIRNNYLEDVGGDPLTTMYAFEPLIEYNVALGGAREISNTYHNDSSKGNKGTVAAGIWPWKSKTALFQYNECYDMRNATDGNNDAQAWDADWGDSTIYQYNYSAGNTGGSVMACLQEAYNTVFRYNISYKDGEGTGVLSPCGAPNGKYYNNTFVVAESANIIRHNMAGGTPTLENNIFYALGTARTVNWYLNTPNAKYDNNLYVNFTNKPSGDATGIQVAAGTDVFATAPVGPTAPKATKGDHGWTHDWTSDFNSFKLKAGSPAINAGKQIDLLQGLGNDHGVDPATNDFYGTGLDASHDIGAHDTAAPDLKLSSTVYTVDQTGKTIAKVPSGLTVELFLTNITADSAVTVQVKKGNVVQQGTALVDMDCVVVLSYNGSEVTYTLVKDSDKDIKACVFELEKNKITGVATNQINVPFHTDFTLSVSTFLAGITVAPTATAAVYSDETEVTSGNISAEMTLKITAQDGTTKSYTIAPKNEYNHITDWIKQPTQGNVWYAQTKTDGAYTNMAIWDATYFCWGDGAPSYASVEDYSITGSIVANSPTAGTAMGFRAPVSGTVRVSFGASENNAVNEIKLRKMEANNASTGTTSMLITNNGTVLPNHTYVLSKTAATTIEPFTMTVTQGDMLRFEAQNLGSTPDAGFSMVPIITYMETPLDESAPAAPTNVVVSDLTATSATLTWTASISTDVTKYVVSYTPASGEVLTQEATTTNCTLVGLAAETSYTVEVKAVDGAGNSSEAASATFTTEAPPHVHGMTATPAQAATCTAGGNTAYWHCAACTKYFSDEAGTTEIALEDTVLPALGHDYGDWHTTTPATCTAPGEQTRTCKHDATHTETKALPQLAHTYADTWSKDETNHWYPCTLCLVDRSMEAAHTSSGDATEEAAETCTICGYIITPALGHTTHTADDVWVFDATGHWHTCTGCSEKMEANIHTWTPNEDASTEQELHYDCLCGATKTEEVQLDKASIDTAVDAAETAKAAVRVSDATPDAVSNGDKFVSTAVMNALDEAIRTAKADKETVTTVQQVQAVVAALEGAVASFTAAIQIGTYIPPAYEPPTSSTVTETTKNPDGSTTKTVTNKTTGTVTKTTTTPTGDKTVIETKKNGTVTETVTRKDGYTSKTVTTKDGGFTSQTTDTAGVVIELSAPQQGVTTATVTFPTTVERTQVVLSVRELTAGTVAVIVHEDGTREVVKTSVRTEGGLRVTLTGSAKLELVDNTKHYEDVTEGHWGAEAIAFVSSRALFNGGDKGFQPAEDMSRAMLFTVLARLDGQELAGGETWYEQAMNWAKERGVSDGTNPEASMTREALATMLYRYSKTGKAGAALTDFVDADSVSDWAAEAMRWAVESGILTGKGGALDPQGSASRAEVATMLMRFVEQMAK